MVAAARREVGDVPPSAVGSGQRVVESFISDLTTWIQTYVDPPWIGFIPRVLASIFDKPPTVRPMQVEVALGQGVTSGAIPFSATQSNGNAIVYSVPDNGMPGGPSRGTVSVNNATGTFTYTPDETFTGTDSFAFVANEAPSTHVRVLDNLVNSVLDFFGLSGGFRDTATVTIFNGVAIQPDPDVAVYTDITGDFSMLTYNVAGLPSLLSGAAWPRIPNMLQIGSQLNDFDIVNVQVDVAYQLFLAANALFPDQTAPQVPAWLGPIGIPFSDGLNTFSAYRIDGVDREEWGGCIVLCVGPTGFTYSRLDIPGGESIDLYNVQANSGASLTNADIAQLSNFIQLNSIGRAVIVTGAFDQLYSTPGQTLSQFVTANGLTDAWVQLEYNGATPVDAPTCAYADSCEQVDKIFYRNAALLDPNDPASSPVQLIAQSYTNEGLNFLNNNGQGLSNRAPQSVTFGYKVTAVGPTNVDPENWMATLPGISDLPLTELPIPGTHDSGSYGITSRSPWALTGISDFGILTEFPPLLEDLVIKPIVAGWAKTQGQSLSEQFANGIRYVDLRFTNEPDGQIYIEHGLRGPTADDVLGQIAQFADTHPKEVLFVYVQGLNNFDAASNAVLVSKMEDAFGSRMAPSALGTSATLQDLWAMDKNVIVVYNDSSTVAGNPDLWPDDTIFRPWWNVPSMDQLYVANETNLEDRPSGTIWGLFGEATPDTTNIVMGLLQLGPRSSQGFTTRGQPTLQQWLRTDFKTSVNLVTEDWYELMAPNESSYTREVLGAVYETLGSRHSSLAA